MLTFVDADVLIAAAKGTEAISRRALSILEDTARQFVSSPFLELETIPQAEHRGDADVLAFYQAFFGAVSRQVTALADIVAGARDESRTHGIAAMDALHVAAAAIAGVDEFVTGEKLTKPIHRTGRVRVVCIRDDA
jgi:predicted nucleic acid-binding protein